MLLPPLTELTVLPLPPLESRRHRFLIEADERGQPLDGLVQVESHVPGLRFACPGYAGYLCM